MYRYDKVDIHAVKTDEGFIKDSPIIGRAGLLTYIRPDGTERVEYRPPEEAFNADSLASIAGKPITVGHHGVVTARNASQIKPVGTVLSPATQDGNDIRADIVIYNLDSANRELSCGYALDLDETPGTTPDGQHYDAIQRNIRYNHLAIVGKGRAGNARLNFDGEQVLDDNEGSEQKNMEKIKLQNGIEYEVPAEVKAAYEDMQNKMSDLQKQVDAANAEKDAANADKEQAQKDAEEAKANGVGSDVFNKAVKDRINVLDTAKKAGVEDAENMDEADIKKAVIKAVRGDSVDLEGKSDAYIDAAYDLCKTDCAHREDGMKKQAKALNNGSGESREDGLTTQDLLQKLRENESKLWEQEV